MQEIIKISTDDKGIKTVSARELYKFLGASERFSNWIVRQFQYGFEENIDYVGCKQFNTLANQYLDDFALTIDTAKEISMLQKNEKGKQARRYFIDIEKKYRRTSISLPQSYSEALRELANTYEQKEIALKKLALKEKTIEDNKHKVIFADSVKGSVNSILIRQFAKDISDSNFKIGQNRLYQWFRDNKYLNINNEPYQNYLDMGLFEVITRSVGSGYQTFTSKTTKITGKGQVYFAEKIKNIKPLSTR